MAICLYAAGGSPAFSSRVVLLPKASSAPTENLETMLPADTDDLESSGLTASVDVESIPSDAAQYALTHKNDTYIYFSNLSENMPTNRAGTCGHVALAMMLTYLDTFWNDFFVEERFEAHSSLEIPDILWTITPQMEFRSGGTPFPGCFDDYVAIMPKEGWEHIHSDNYRVDDDDLDQVVSWCPCDTEVIVREESVPDLELIDLEVGDNWYGFDIDGNFTCKFDGTGWGIKDGGVIVSPVKTSESSMTRVSDFMFCVEENAYRIDLLGQIDFFLYDDVVITGIFGAAPVNSDDEIQGFPYSISSSSILTDRWGDVARDGWDTGLSLTATNESQGPFGIMLEAALIMFPAIPVEPVQIAIDSFKVMEIAP